MVSFWPTVLCSRLLLTDYSFAGCLGAEARFRHLSFFRSSGCLQYLMFLFHLSASSFTLLLVLILALFFFQPAIVDEKGNELEGECSGYLCMKHSWPSAFRTLYGDHERYETTYFKPFPGYYFTGDGCSRYYCTNFIL